MESTVKSSQMCYCFLQNLQHSVDDEVNLCRYCLEHSQSWFHGSNVCHHGTFPCHVVVVLHFFTSFQYSIANFSLKFWFYLVSSFFLHFSSWFLRLQVLWFWVPPSSKVIQAWPKLFRSKGLTWEMEDLDMLPLRYAGTDMGIFINGIVPYHVKFYWIDPNIKQHILCILTSERELSPPFAGWNHFFLGGG